MIKYQISILSYRTVWHELQAVTGWWAAAEQATGPAGFMTVAYGERETSGEGG